MRLFASKKPTDDFPVWHSLNEAREVSDKQLCQSLMHTFETDLAFTGLSGIHFYIKDQVVTLHGSVADQTVRKTLIRFVSLLPDVRRVEDQLIVARRYPGRRKAS